MKKMKIVGCEGQRVVEPYKKKKKKKKKKSSYSQLLRTFGRVRHSVCPVVHWFKWRTFVEIVNSDFITIRT
jgi:hypothetical protein